MAHKTVMHSEALRDFCLAQKGTTEAFPFDANTLVFKVMGKLFALLPLERVPPQCNLKCDPQRAIELREEYSGVIVPGYCKLPLKPNCLKEEY